MRLLFSNIFGDTIRPDPRARPIHDDIFDVRFIGPQGTEMFSLLPNRVERT